MAHTTAKMTGRPANPSFAVRKRKRNWADYLILAVLTFLALVSLFPFYNVVLVSFGEARAMLDQPIYLLPVSFDFSAYSYIFSNALILNSFLVSVFITIVGTILCMAITITTAYALTKKKLPGRKFFLLYIVVTMFFSGGLIPYYLTIKNLGFVNSVWVMILPAAINTFYLFIMYSYFRTVPAALEESARIDGANEIKILIHIVIPVSVPTIAAISLFYAVERWNEWWSAMLFIRDLGKYPLQLLLREMLADFQKVFQGGMGAAFAAKSAPILPETLKMAVVVVSTIPVFLVYPFLLKYFAKGIMIGSVKE